MTISVSRVACALEGQETLVSSVLTSFKKRKGFAFWTMDISMVREILSQSKGFFKAKALQVLYQQNPGGPIVNLAPVLWVVSAREVLQRR